MSDTLTPEKRSWNMSRIHSTDTSIEIAVRHWLYHQGYRYRKNVKSLPGKPDIVLRSYNTIILIQGCFWHRHPGCKVASVPKTRADYWQAKFSRNIANDEKNIQELTNLGFSVIVLWECEIEKHFEETMTKVVRQLGPPRKNIADRTKKCSQ